MKLVTQFIQVKDHVEGQKRVFTGRTRCGAEDHDTKSADRVAALNVCATGCPFYLFAKT